MSYMKRNLEDFVQVLADEAGCDYDTALDVINALNSIGGVYILTEEMDKKEIINAIHSQHLECVVNDYLKAKSVLVRVVNNDMDEHDERYLIDAIKTSIKALEIAERNAVCGEARCWVDRYNQAPVQDAYIQESMLSDIECEK